MRYPKLCGGPAEFRPLERVDTQRLPGAALLIGNEGNGLLPGTVAAADKAVRIPMAAGVESLNAAVAGGVLLWHFREV
ncbi:MAG: TrmH family RNA methyltransferase [Ruthenibacterium lactatiformans]